MTQISGMTSKHLGATHLPCVSREGRRSMVFDFILMADRECIALNGGCCDAYGSGKTERCPVCIISITPHKVLGVCLRETANALLSEY